jgi:hypothetical protein
LDVAVVQVTCQSESFRINPAQFLYQLKNDLLLAKCRVLFNWQADRGIACTKVGLT